MNDGVMILAGLGRNPLRTALLCVSIAGAFLMFGVIGGTLVTLGRFVDVVPANRLLVTDKVNYTRSLPLSHFERVLQIPHVADATFENWFGAYYGRPAHVLNTLAVDGASWQRIKGKDCQMPAEQWRAFQADPAAIAVVDRDAARYGIKLGQTLTLNSNMYTNRLTGRPLWTFNVRGIVATTGIHQFHCANAFFHNDYFRRTVNIGANDAGVITLLTDVAANNAEVVRAIDGMFAGSGHQTLTLQQRAFTRAAIRELGDVDVIMLLGLAATFVTALLIVGTTLMQATLERASEVRLLARLGFSRRRILVGGLGESFLLAMVGAGAGLAATPLVIGKLVPPVSIYGSDLPAALYLGGVAAALAFGLVTGLAASTSRVAAGSS